MSYNNIRSAAFPNVFLRMDGSQVLSNSDSGGGTVNCQYTPPGNYEVFEVIDTPSGGVNIRSAYFPNVFLRMDGKGITGENPHGEGVVNLQFAPPGAWEEFRLVPQSDGTVSIASVAFPNVVLRMDGTNVTSFTVTGGGSVDCQYEVGPWEKFVLVPASPPATTAPPPTSPAAPNPLIVNLGPDFSKAQTSFDYGGYVLPLEYSFPCATPIISKVANTTIDTPAVPVLTVGYNSSVPSLQLPNGQSTFEFAGQPVVGTWVGTGAESFEHPGQNQNMWGYTLWVYWECADAA